MKNFQCGKSQSRSLWKTKWDKRKIQKEVTHLPLPDANEEGVIITQGSANGGLWRTANPKVNDSNFP